jgi:transposase
VWKRVLFAAVQAGCDAEDVVVLDEFGTNTNMTPRYARSPSGERVYEQSPRNTPRNTTTLASLSTHGIGPTIVMNGSLTRAVFETYIQDVLGPTLRQGQVIVLDNAKVHHGGRIAELLAARGCGVLYLPPYSPDFSPIELAFAKIKAQIRRCKARTREALEQAIEQALATISATEARAFFAHCGYPLWPITDQ